MKHTLRALFLTTLILPAVLYAQSSGTHPAATHPKEPVDYVNVFTGTSNSRWMQFPGATVPFGRVKLSPDNQGNVWDGGYEYTIASIASFGHLHTMGLNGVNVMPLVGAIENEPGQSKLFAGPSDGPFGVMWTSGYRSRIRKETEIGRPGYYGVDLIDAKTHAELTATMRTGWMRLKFPKTDNAHVLFDFSATAEESPELLGITVERVGDREIRGSIRQKNQYAGEFTVYFVSQFSEPFSSMGSWEVGKYEGADRNYGTEWRAPRTLHRDVKALETKNPAGVWLDFKSDPAATLVIRTGISLVGLDQAKQDLEAESSPFGWNFDAVTKAARENWNTLLKRIAVEGGSEDNRVKFYTNFYRVYSAKTVLDDIDGSYRDACGAVQKLAPPADHVYSSDAMWGAQWTLGPLWSLVTPELMNSYINFMLLEAKRDGWLPYAPVNLRYSPIMAAPHEVATLAGAWQKGIRGYDGEAAWSAVDKVLSTPGEPYTCAGSFPGGFAGDRHLKPYLELGYVPEEVGPASSTFEYAYDDSCAATLARSLGKTSDASRFARRAANWRNSFDQSIGYARRRHANGTWVDSFDPHHFGTGGGWNGPGFLEGTPWIYSWFVPQDVAGLVEIVGRDRFNDRLEEGFTKGYVDLTNEPNMQAPWLFNFSGRPWLTQKYARDMFARVFDTSPLNGWPGEEDEGQMGALVVLAGIGLFDMEGGCSDEPGYQVSGPAFNRVVLHLGKRDFEIVAHNNSAKIVYIQSATLNGMPLKSFRLRHADVARGGKLVLEMGPAPRMK